MVTVAELQALRQARLDLLTGKRVVSVQKDGRRIEYTAASLDELNRAINDAESVPDSELDSWMESRIYPVMSDIPALSDLLTSMVASGYDYRRDDDAGLWSSADLTYVITYEM